MNPQAGDTVTSTKLPTTTTTTSTTTTGARHFSRAATLRPEAAATSSKARSITRKRRQQVELDLQQQQQQQLTTRPCPEVNTPPPQKTRRRATAAEQGRDERMTNKSRLGDFFSSITSRIRWSKNEETKDYLKDQTGDTVHATQSVKREGNKTIVQSECTDFNKRRKIDIDRGEQNYESHTNTEEVKETLADEKSYDSKSTDECGVSMISDACPEKNCNTSVFNSQNKEDSSQSVLQCNSCAVSNEILEGEKELICEDSDKITVEEGIDSESDIDLFLNEIKTDEESENKIIDMCRSIVASMCEKIDETVEVQTHESSLESSNECEAFNLANDNSLQKLTAESSASEEVSLGSESKINSTEVEQLIPEQKITEAEKNPEFRISLKVGNSRPSSRSPRRDDTIRLRKTIQWLEEGARRLREDLASVRSELHEERRAARLARRELDSAIREARNAEAAKYTAVISELRTKLSQSPSRSAMDSLPSSSKTEILKDENHRREMAALKKRLAEAESTIQKLKINSLDRGRAKNKNKQAESGKLMSSEVRRLEVEVQSLRSTNKKLEEKLHIAEESAKARASELRAQHESHEAELAALQKALRSDTIKMIDEIQSKNREIEKLEKLVNESTQINQKLRTKEDETMRKLRESERSHQIRLAPKIEEKIVHHDNHVVDLCKVECENDVAATELDRLRELAIEQQEVIEVLRQAVKEKERKLDQLTNKRRKEEFYKQWLELEPVAEVDDEEEQQHEEGDSAVSSAPSSLSPQPNASRNNGVTREAYENVLIEIEELQTKLLEEQRELGHARSQVRDLEKALLQETRGSQNSRRALSEKLRVAEEREAALIGEISELREQNELLEFRVLELEESPNPRDTPDPADSGIVSPEPIHLYKDHQSSKHRDRAIATVIPYSSSYSHPVLPSDPQKAPLSLQESGIFEGEDVEEEEEEEGIEDNVEDENKIELASQSTQTEAPAGELLQEVQRLQELRARIQERAAKVPPVSPITDRKTGEASGDFALDVAPLRERIRELEERLDAHESERRISKQREEELLDENYRLTEKTFWLEAELKKLQEKLDRVKLTSDVETMTDPRSEQPDRDVLDNSNKIVMDDPAGSAELSSCRKLYERAVLNPSDENGSPKSEAKGSASKSRKSQQPCPDCSELWKDCDARIHNLARTEFCLREQIASLEQRESAFFETLRQTDATWAKLEADYEAKQREMNDRLTAQVELNRALFEHLTSLNKTAGKALEEPMQVDDDVAANSKRELTRATQTDELESCCSCQRTSSLSRSSFGLIARADSGRTSTISRTSINIASAGCDEIDTKTAVLLAPTDPPAEVATEAKEDDIKVQQRRNSKFEMEKPSSAAAAAANAEQRPEALVSIDESSSDKKQIIYFRWR